MARVEVSSQLSVANNEARHGQINVRKGFAMESFFTVRPRSSPILAVRLVDMVSGAAEISIQMSNTHEGGSVVETRVFESKNLDAPMPKSRRQLDLRRQTCQAFGKEDNPADEHPL